MKYPLLIDPVSLAVPSWGHLFTLLVAGLIFSHRTTSSDIGQGYERGAGPLRGSGASSAGDFSTSERGIGARGITESTVGVGLLAESDGELHKGNLISRLALSL